MAHRILSIYMKPEEYALIEAAARADNAKTVNAWVRLCLVTVAKTMKVEPLPEASATFMGRPVDTDK